MLELINPCQQKEAPRLNELISSYLTDQEVRNR